MDVRDPGCDDVAGGSCMLLAVGEARAGSPLETCYKKLLKLENPWFRQEVRWRSWLERKGDSVTWGKLSGTEWCLGVSFWKGLDPDEKLRDWLCCFG